MKLYEKDKRCYVYRIGLYNRSPSRTPFSIARVLHTLNVLMRTTGVHVVQNVLNRPILRDRINRLLYGMCSYKLTAGTDRPPRPAFASIAFNPALVFGMALLCVLEASCVLNALRDSKNTPLVGPPFSCPLCFASKHTWHLYRSGFLSHRLE